MGLQKNSQKKRLQTYPEVKRPLSSRQWKKQNSFARKFRPAAQQGGIFHAAARWNSIGVMHLSLCRQRLLLQK